MTKTVSIVAYDLPNPNYVNEAAEKRGLSVTALLRRVLTTVIRDEMILAVLDDNDLPTGKRAGERKNITRRLEGAVAEARTSSIKPRPAAPTRGELREQLTQALVNTGAQRVTYEQRRDAILEKLVNSLEPLPVNDLGGVNSYQALQRMVEEGHVRRVSDAYLSGRGPTVRYELATRESAPVEISVDERVDS